MDVSHVSRPPTVIEKPSCRFGQKSEGSTFAKLSLVQFDFPAIDWTVPF